TRSRSGIILEDNVRQFMSEFDLSDEKSRRNAILKRVSRKAAPPESMWKPLTEITVEKAELQPTVRRLVRDPITENRSIRPPLEEKRQSMPDFGAELIKLQAMMSDMQIQMEDSEKRRRQESHLKTRDQEIPMQSYIDIS